MTSYKFVYLERAAAELVRNVEERTADIGWIKTHLPGPAAPTITWDDMVKTYKQLCAAFHPQVTIVGDAVWADILNRSTDEERDALEQLRAEGAVVVSDVLPEGVAGYRYTPPIDA